MNDDSWIKHLRSKVEGIEEKAPDDLWNDIERSMRGKPMSGGDKGRRGLVVPLWAKLTGAAAAIVAAVWLSIIFLPTETFNNIQKDLTANTYSTDERRETCEKEKNTQSATSLSMDELAAATEMPVAHVKRLKSSADNAEAARSESVVAYEKGIAEECEMEKDSCHRVPENREPANTYRNIASADGRKTAAKQVPSRQGKWSLNLYASNITRHTSKQSEFIASPYTPHGSAITLQQTSDIREVVMLNNSDNEIECEMKHNMPVRAGLTVRYDFSRRLGVSTGVVYSYLSSDFRLGGESSFYEGIQRLHYIGLPVSLIYNVWGNDRLQVYTSGGVMAEKCISGRVTTDYFLKGVHEATHSESATEKRLQWSVNAAAGVQYRLVGDLSLYAEPGMSYYFDNHSSTENIYKERKLNFNLNVGLRYTIH